MNFDRLSKKLGLEVDEYLELYALFVETCTADLKLLQSAIDASDMAEIARIVHSLKGAALNLGLDEFFELVTTIEKTTGDGKLNETAETVRIFQAVLNKSV